MKRGATLTNEERQAVDRAIRDLQNAYHSDDHHVIQEKIDPLNQSTMKLAETMMNTAVRGALRGTKSIKRETMHRCRD